MLTELLACDLLAKPVAHLHVSDIRVRHDLRHSRRERVQRVTADSILAALAALVGDQLLCGDDVHVTVLHVHFEAPCVAVVELVDNLQTAWRLLQPNSVGEPCFAQRLHLRAELTLAVHGECGTHSFDLLSRDELLLERCLPLLRLLAKVLDLVAADALVAFFRQANLTTLLDHDHAGWAGTQVLDRIGAKLVLIRAGRANRQIQVASDLDRINTSLLCVLQRRELLDGSTLLAQRLHLLVVVGLDGLAGFFLRVPKVPHTAVVSHSGLLPFSLITTRCVHRAADELALRASYDVTALVLTTRHVGHVVFATHLRLLLCVERAEGFEHVGLLGVLAEYTVHSLVERLALLRRHLVVGGEAVAEVLGNLARVNVADAATLRGVALHQLSLRSDCLVAVSVCCREQVHPLRVVIDQTMAHHLFGHVLDHTFRALLTTEVLLKLVQLSLGQTVLPVLDHLGDRREQLVGRVGAAFELVVVDVRINVLIEDVAHLVHASGRFGVVHGLGLLAETDAAGKAVNGVRSGTVRLMTFHCIGHARPRVGSALRGAVIEVRRSLFHVLGCVAVHHAVC